MSYIGTAPTIGNFQVCDAISVVNGQASYTMQVSSVNVVPQSSFHMLVSLNGILQKPNSSFTVSGSTITFASNLQTGDVIDFIHILGDVLDLGVPSDNTVSASKLTNDIISGQTELASEPADTDEFLVSDAGTIKRIDYSLIKGGGITMADNWRITADFSGKGTMTSNWERNDNISTYIGTGMSESSGIFTFPETGIYFVTAQSYIDETFSGALEYCGIQIMGSTNGSSTIAISQTYDSSGAQNRHMSLYCSAIYDVTNTSNNNIRLNADHSGVSNTDATYGGSTTHNYTALTFIRLGDT